MVAVRASSSRRFLQLGIVSDYELTSNLAPIKRAFVDLLFRRIYHKESKKDELLKGSFILEVESCRFFGGCGVLFLIGYF